MFFRFLLYIRWCAGRAFFIFHFIWLVALISAPFNQLTVIEGLQLYLEILTFEQTIGEDSTLLSAVVWFGLMYWPMTWLLKRALK